MVLFLFLFLFLLVFYKLSTNKEGKDKIEQVLFTVIQESCTYIYIHLCLI